MRLYGKKFARKFIDRRVAAKSEGRDAICWYVDTTSKICRCKIQGTAELIYAHFPRNWTSTPYWMKPGNAVHIRHRNGVRGYIEVAGEGRAIPTPTVGTALPSGEALADAVVSGCEATPTTPETLAVLVASGTIRIDGTIYIFTPDDEESAIIMNDPAPMVMGSMNLMGVYIRTVDIDPAPTAGSYRYDLLCAGADGVLDYITGDVSTTPVKPSLPADHVMLGDYILVRGGVSTIENADIGADWATPYLAELEMDIDGGGSHCEFAWDAGDNTPEVDIVLTIKDQYGNTLSTVPDGYSIKLSLMAGTGQVYSADDGYSSSYVTQACSGTCTLKYQRDQTVTEQMPVLYAELLGSTTLEAAGFITLLDVAGEPI